ncbi:MAG: hypothetical protein ACE37F_03690 [Nannocystaceae bacterium]|nr:hypothetical protein [bacterium]
MPSQLHEELVSLVRENEALARILVESATGRALSDDLQLRLHEQVYSQLEALDCRADLVFEFVRDGSPEPAELMAFDVQLAPDPEKRFIWPVLQCVLRSERQCPTWLVVLAPERDVAAWCAERIDVDALGRSFVQPIVIGPDRIAAIVDSSAAQRVPGLSVLSEITHGKARP